MTTRPRPWRLSLLVILCAHAAHAAPWESLVEDQSRAPLPLSFGVSVPVEGGHWLISSLDTTSVEEPTRGVIARYDGTSTEPAALASTPFYYVDAALELGDGGLLITQNVGGFCGFDGFCPSKFYFAALDAQARLRWTTEIDGDCAFPVNGTGGQIWMSCGDQLEQRSVEGRVLSRHLLPTFGASAEQRSLHVRGDDVVLSVLDNLRLELTLIRFAPDGRIVWQQTLKGDYRLPVLTDDLAFATAQLVDAAADTAAVVTTLVDLGTGTVSEHSRLPIANVDGPRWLTTAAGNRLYLASLPTDGGAYRLHALAPQGPPIQLAELPTGPEPVQLDTLNGGSLVTLVNDDTAQLLHIDASGTVQWTLDAESRSRPSVSVAADGRVFVQAFDNDRPGTSLRQFDGNGNALGAPIDRVLVAASQQGGRIDPSRSTAWSYTPSDRTGTAQMARSAFASGESEVFRFPEQESRAPAQPIAVGDAHCVLSGSATANAVNLLCAPSLGERGQAAIRIPLDQDEFAIALRGTPAGDALILTSRPALGLPERFYRQIRVSPDGQIVRSEGAIASPRVISVNDDLRSVVGNQVLAADASIDFRIPGPLGQQWPQVKWLKDGDLLHVRGSQMTTLLSRYSPQGQLRWEVEPPEGFGLGSLNAVLGGRLVSERRRGYLQQSADQYSIDLATGTTVSSQTRLIPQDLGARLIAIDESDPSPSLWRLSTMANAVLVEALNEGPLPAAQRFWFDCAMAQCLIQALDTDAAGRLLIKLSGWSTSGATVKLGTIDLAQARLTSGPPADLDRSARWHYDNGQYGGLIVGRMRGERAPRRYRLDAEAGRPSWTHLQREFGYAADSSAVALVSPKQPKVPVGRGYLASLADDQLLLQSETQRAPASSRLLRRAETAHSQMWFNSADHWLALDEITGEGIWALPDGRWYRLLRQQRSRWQVEERVESAQPYAGWYGNSTPPEARRLGTVELRIEDCRRATLRLVGGTLAGDASVARLGPDTAFEAGADCR